MQPRQNVKNEKNILSSDNIDDVTKDYLRGRGLRGSFLVPLLKVKDFK
jgi:hypothetical protein